MITIQGKQKLADFLGVSYNSIDTNFPKTAARQLAKGLQITRQGKGENTIYIIEEVEPQQVDKLTFSQREKISSDLDNEIWKQHPNYPHHWISNYGRIKNQYNYAVKGSFTHNGYLQVELKTGEKKMLHRLVLETFSPVANSEEYSVDHINGIRTDNRLENLRWCPQDDNILFMMLQRKELNKELTRIIQKHGYEATLQLLQNL